MSMQVRVNEPIENIEMESKAPVPKKQIQYQSFDYASLRNLTHEHEKQPTLLPGLGRKGLKIPAPRVKQETEIIEQPKLLSTAKRFIQQIHEESAQSSAELENQLGMNSFMLSREQTPNNPLLACKKRNPTTRNKVNSMASELFSINSNPEDPEDKSSKFKNPAFRLYDSILGQSQLVYQYVFGKPRTVNPKTIQMWKDCLSHQDKSEIYLPVGNQKVEIPFSNARIYPLNKIEKQFKTIYGTGRNRALTAGEEAIIIESIKKYLNLCNKEPLKISRKDFDILEDILRDCKLQQLQNYPYCMKQAENHFKLLATKWKYSGQLDTKDRMVDTALIMGKNNFLDLSRHNILTQFLLNNSNISDF